MTPVRILLAICATTAVVVCSRAEASDKLSHDIVAQPLAQALGDFADQTGLQLIYVSEIAATQASKGAPRGLEAPDALRRLLAGTGLGFEFLNDRTVRILAGPGCDGKSGCSGPSARTTALPPKSPSAPSRPDSLEEVIVAGSRFWLRPTTSIAPVTVLDRRDIGRGGESSIGDVLQKLPMTTGSPLNTNRNTPGWAEPRGTGAVRGDGSVRIALHDLPTVVLLNGRRLPNSGLGADASVDLNTIPMSFIERVEVLAGGASAVVGADAVGGVVNVVTRRNHRGIELSGTRTITEQGDGEIVTGQMAIGSDLFGGSWSFGIDYVEQDPVTMDRRKYSALPLVITDSRGTVEPIGLNTIPADGIFIVPEGNALGLEPGGYTRVEGANGQTAADYRLYDHFADGFNPAAFNYSQTPNERASLWMLGSRPLGETTSLIFEAFAQHRESAQQAAPGANWSSLVTLTPVFWAVAIPADNYYNPFGVDIPWLSRRLVEAGNRRTEQEVDMWRALIGLEGSVALWTWELTLQGAGSEAADVEIGVLRPSRLDRALGPSGLDESGHIVCGLPDPATGRVPVVNVIPDCVPLNLFGGAGSITEEQLAYVMPRSLTDRGTNEQLLAEFVMSGAGGRIRGEDVQWVLGAEYRREKGSLTRDPTRAMDFDFVTGEPFASHIGGIYEAREMFAEAQIPLLADRPWAKEVTLNVGLRWSDFSTSDQATTSQAGLRWRMTEELALRANYAEIFRAPAIAEIYDPRLSFEGYWDFDPCGNDPTPAQQANCEANGVPGGAYVQGEAGEELFTALAGGNPELEPESGDSLGIGAIYSPMWASGLSASIDYFQVELTDYIWQAYPFQVLFECAEHGLAQACEAIRRFPDGRLSHVATYTENFGGLDVRGFDIAFDWSSMTRLGEVNAGVLATYLERWNEQPIPGGVVYRYAGNFDAGARPRWRASGHIDWRSGPWMASYAAEYIGSYSEFVEPFPAYGIEFEPFYRSVDSILYHDIEAGFEFDTGVSVRAGITNVSNEDPPYLDITPGNTDVATYRLLGRTYFFELRYQVQ
jgi:outer membrane receptor protein involved in Fe transport